MKHLLSGNSRKLGPTPQDKLSQWQDILGYGEQNFLKLLCHLKRGKKKKSYINLTKKQNILKIRKIISYSNKINLNIIK